MYWIIILLSSLLLCGCGSVEKYTTEGTYTPNEAMPVWLLGLTLDELVSENVTPRQIAYWINDKVKYASDINPEDEFRNPALTISLGYGDCDDYARLGEYIFDLKGIEASVVCITNSNQAHAVCYTNQGILSNGTWIESNYPKEESWRVVWAQGYMYAEHEFYNKVYR